MRHALRMAEQRARMQDLGEESTAHKNALSGSSTGFGTGPVRATQPKSGEGEEKLMFMKELEMAMSSAKVTTGKPDQAMPVGRRNSAKQSAGRLKPVEHDAGGDMSAGLPMSTLAGLSQTKAAFDAMSRRSTAMSNDGGLTEHGTPGQVVQSAAKISQRGDSAKLRRQSANKNRNSNGDMTGTNQLLQEASNEAITLSLNPQQGKKKKAAPRVLKPIDYQKQAPKGGKIVGNYAAQVLADLEAKDKNREMATAMRKLDKDIKGYLKFDVKGMAEQMNDAFVGSKDGSETTPTTKEKPGKDKKQPLAITAGGSSAALAPILEEPSHPGYNVAVFKPNQTLAEQRKAKNDELKRKVRMITAAEKLETGSVMSDASSVQAGTFITRTKEAGKKKQQRSDSSSSSSSTEAMKRRPESPTTRAAQALAIMNKKPEEPREVVPYDSDSIYAHPERELYEDQQKLEDEMNAMFKELEEMQEMIRGNKDLAVMNTLKDTTKEVVTTHIKNYDKIKNDIIKMNSKAEEAIDKLSFYGNDDLEPSDNPDEDKKKKPKVYKLPEVIDELDDIEEDDEAAVMIEGGGKKFSHEAQKKSMYDQMDFMQRSMRDFGQNIEKKLDDVYKFGATGKFGFDDVASQSSVSTLQGQTKAERTKERELNRIAREAREFLEKEAKRDDPNIDLDVLSMKSGVSINSKTSKATLSSLKMGMKSTKTGQPALKPRNMTKK